jgi:tRNA nucleotidyltransferase (CCA-adding enzyme)
MRVADGFNTLLSRIEPTERDINIYESHRQSITRRLETVFSTNKVELIGSCARGSSIRATSDIDLLLILKREEVKWGEGYKSSTTILDHVRSELLNRYPMTPVVRDVHAIVTRFADNQHPVDVVPGFYWKHGGALNYPIFAIPDGSGGWMLTSPQSHNKFINDADAKSGGKLKRVARLIKF